ncbi:argininosuccinate synthase [Candidatus Geothermarchaeota archaeon ex4572_27]|nr:MAG: argininosuccinate synthase [Candidatus Geothermarchaeota archaeon ex4572_27]
MVKWLQEKYGAEVVTVTLDVGQGEDLREIEERAWRLGVVNHYSIDAKREFVERFVFRAIKANALYEGKYPVSTALSRPLIAEKLVEVARKEGADAVAHGCTGKGNDQVRIEVTVKALSPDLKVIAPVREWGLTREAEIEYARRHGIPVKERRSVYSVDQNLWGRSIECGPLEDPAEEPPEECGPLEDPAEEPPEEVFEWTVPPSRAPNEPCYVSIRFERGVPVELNGERLDGVELISRLNRVAGMHGVGRIDHVEDRLVGIKSREVYECPAAMCIIEAHRDLEKLVLTRHELAFKELVDREWTQLVYTGLWADPLREDLEAFIDSCEERVEGEVRLKLYKGSLMAVARSSPYSLYEHSLATYGPESTFDQSWSKGFIEIWGLQSVVARRRARRP